MDLQRLHHDTATLVQGPSTPSRQVHKRSSIETICEFVTGDREGQIRYTGFMTSVEQRINETLHGLTPKQLQALALVAEGRTNKEIAAELDISVSAAVQRIEAIRNRFDGASKAQLGRIYREFFVQSIACNEDTGKSFQLPIHGQDRPASSWDQPSPLLTVADVTFEVAPPWAQGRGKRLVPEMLDGRNAVAYRWIVALGLALGMAILSLVLLAVAEAIGDML